MSNDEEIVHNREQTMALFNKMAKSGAEAAVVIIKRNGVAECHWNGSTLEAHTLACLGKQSIWDVLCGDGDAEFIELKDKNDEFDFNELLKGDEE